MLTGLSGPLPSNASVPIVERRYLSIFMLVASLFFAWALAAGLNDVLIRQFQKALDLTRTQSSFIQLAFYIGYFCAALPAGMLIRKLGYKGGIIFGLGCYAFGAFLFYPAAQMQTYGLFLAALYIIAFGLAFLETAANPYIAILGAPDTASARLNLAQAFNGVGSIFGPIIGGLFIFSGVEHSKADIAALAPDALAAYRTAEASMVQVPYVALGLCVCLLAVLVWRGRFPALDADASEGARPPIFAVLRHRHLRWAVIAQFFYVGAQVGIWSFFIDFAKDQMPGVGERTTAFLLSGSLAMLMIGRFSGAFIQQHVAPTKLLALYAVINIVLCAVAVLANGLVAVGALWLTSLFMSIMFPTIFALGVSGLGRETEAGSSFIIMAIIGGALIPPLMGYLSESIGGVHHMMLIPMACFCVCLVFALTVDKVAGRARFSRTVIA